jgi:hypothetical protein
MAYRQDSKNAKQRKKVMESSTPFSRRGRDEVLKTTGTKSEAKERSLTEKSKRDSELLRCRSILADCRGLIKEKPWNCAREDRRLQLSC